MTRDAILAQVRALRDDWATLVDDPHWQIVVVGELDAILRDAEPVSPAPVGAAETWLSMDVAPKDGTPILAFALSHGVQYWFAIHWLDCDDGSSGWIGNSFWSQPEGNWTTVMGETLIGWVPLPAAPTEVDPGRSGLPVRMPQNAPSGAQPQGSAPRSASLDAAPPDDLVTLRMKLDAATTAVERLGTENERLRKAAETPAPEPTPKDEDQVRRHLAPSLVNGVWLCPHCGETGILANAINHPLCPAFLALKFLARAPSAPVVAAPAPTPQELRGAIARLYWTIPPECADARRELRAFEELLLPRTRIAAVAAPAETPTWQRPVLNEVEAERQRQDAQWGGHAHDDTHSNHDWLAFIGRQVGLGRRVGQARERFLKIAALAVAAIESMDRKADPAPPSGAPTKETP